MAMQAYHVAKPGLEIGSRLEADFNKLKPRVSAFVRAHRQGPLVFAATLISAGYTDAVVESTLGIKLGTHASKWAAEGLVESIRIKNHNHCPPRHQSVFLFNGPDEANRFITEYRSDSPSAIYRCSIESPSCVHLADMAMFTKIDSVLVKAEVREPIAEMMPRLEAMANSYWSPDGAPPCGEILVAGGDVRILESLPTAHQEPAA